MKTEIHDDKEASIILDDTFDFKCVESFRTAYESLPASKLQKINVNFRQTRCMDSSALGMLLNMKKYFADQTTRIHIINTNEKIRKIFQISRFDQKFNIS